MKLNFWQWLGVVLLLVGIAVYAYQRMSHSRPAATAPAATR